MLKTIHLAIDGNEANTKNRVGSNVYAFAIINHIYNLTKNQKYQVTVLLSKSAVADLPSARNNWQYQVVTPAKFWTQWALPIHLFLHKNSYDVFYTPGHYAPRISSVPYLSSVMDLAFLKFPQYFQKKDLWQLTNWTKYSVRHARKIIVISQASKKDVIKYYAKKSSDVLIAYPAHDLNMAEKTYPVNNPYLLYVGTIQPRKNLINLVEAFEKLSRQLPLKQGRRKIDQLDLVIAGKAGWLSEPILERIKLSPFAKNIILTGFISEAEKNYLIKNALALVLVSLYEGFGIPVLEAMQMGVLPVVAKNSEVVGKAGLTCQAQNINSIYEALKKAMTLNARSKAIYQKNMSQQVQKFSWAKSAQIVLDALVKVAHGQ